MRKIKIAVIGLVGAALLLFTGTAAFAEDGSQSISGTLELKDGVIAVATGSASYYVPSLSRYVGFIDGLKEGAKVSMTGSFYGSSSFLPTEMTLNGKDYALTGGSGASNTFALGGGFAGSSACPGYGGGSSAGYGGCGGAYGASWRN